MKSAFALVSLSCLLLTGSSVMGCVDVTDNYLTDSFGPPYAAVLETCDQHNAETGDEVKIYYSIPENTHYFRWHFFPTSRGSQILPTQVFKCDGGLAEVQGGGIVFKKSGTDGVCISKFGANGEWGDSQNMEDNIVVEYFVTATSTERVLRLPTDIECKMEFVNGGAYGPSGCELNRQVHDGFSLDCAAATGGSCTLSVNPEHVAHRGCSCDDNDPNHVLIDDLIVTQLTNPVNVEEYN